MTDGKRRPPRTLVVALVLAGLAAGCTRRPVALAGLDPVLLVEGERVQGSGDHTLAHGGFFYRFASAASMRRFEQEPERYRIQLDGRCAVRQDGTAGDPATFTVYEGRIYVFSSGDHLQAFNRDPEGYVGGHLLTTGGPGGSPVAAPARDGPGETGSWPQFGGPERDFTAGARGLARRWPPGRPRRLWSRPLGEGYSAISALDGRLYTMYRRQNDEVVIAMDAATGGTLWEFAYPAPFDDRYNLEHGTGPHSTPLVVDDLVVAAGATGRLHALDRQTGQPRWSHDLIRDFGGTRPYRGYACSPLAYRNTVILMVGGEGSAVMAFDRRQGSVIWSRHDYANSPSSPILIDVDGQEQLVAFMAKQIVGLDPGSGELLWTHPHETDWGLNISMPVWGEDNLLFVSSAYGGGSRVIRLTRDGDRTTAEELWANRRMRLHFGNAIRIGERVYGSSGDFGPAFFAAVDVHNGEIAWRQRGLAKASFLLADGLFVILDESGVLALATPTTAGLEVHSQVQLFESVSWTVPTLVGTTLYVRDREQILALDLG